MRVRSRRELLFRRLAHDANDECRHRTFDPLHVARLDAVPGAQAEYRADIRMNHVRGGKRLERRIAALPMLAQTIVYAGEVAMRVRILHVRSEQSEASFEHFCGARYAR